MSNKENKAAANETAAVETEKVKPVEVEFVLATGTKGDFYEAGQKAKLHPDIAERLIGQGRVFIANVEE